ncbi:reverse transcriptase [Gossypium australe]|uniref:Reverse transcriptase n=1 Tax=Gossypium australe TaxID=47621 RepID=A0A5B6UZE3_9ROSI|nr:reverse transcriptase [Gossypium australe]
MDVGYSRNWFTWERGNLLETNIREQLDRDVANENWMTMFPEAIKLNYLQTGLGEWAKRICLDTKRRKDFLNSKLNELMEADRSDDNMAELIDTKLQLNLEIDKDERYWEQRARVNWLKLGDRNTAFFHKQATQRHRKTALESYKT